MLVLRVNLGLVPIADDLISVGFIRITLFIPTVNRRNFIKRITDFLKEFFVEISVQVRIAKVFGN